MSMRIRCFIRMILASLVRFCDDGKRDGLDMDAFIRALFFSQFGARDERDALPIQVVCLLKRIQNCP